jgi:hypothetical protein
MEPEKKEVEKKEVDASTTQQEVKKEESGASADQKVVDFAAELAKKDAELAKLATEKENYRLGMLKAKGKIQNDEVVDEVDKPDLDSLISEKVQAALYSEKERQLQAEKDALLQDALKKVKELSTALSNKQGISTAASGTSSDSAVTTTQYFSNEQIAELKARGLTDEMIKKAAINMQNKR